MFHRARTAAMIAALLFTGSASLLAQRFGNPPEPRSGVCFYQDVNFRGSYFCVRAGESLAMVPNGTNDHISSVRVFGNADVVVYQNARFRGQSARFTNSVRDLRTQGWNDLISSMRVTSSFSGGRPGNGNGNGGPSWGHGPIPREGACFYKDANFRGDYFCLRRGDSFELVPPGFNDQISSIRVMRSMVMVFSDRDYGGRSTRIGNNVPNLRGNMADRVSSIRVF